MEKIIKSPAKDNPPEAYLEYSDNNSPNAFKKRFLTLFQRI